jgi:hypothetical protein
MQVAQHNLHDQALVYFELAQIRQVAKLARNTWTKNPARKLRAG